ncbi:MAG TPA: type II toxin-antitoxin system VapC family toxin, partial [Beijerinckiaceae bacterium]
HSGIAARILLSVPKLTAPDLIRIEISGALTKAVRRKQISAEYAAAAFMRLRATLPPLEATEPLIDRSFALSLELDHPFADCVFLAQAEARADTLVTGDRRFVRKLAGTAHAMRVIALSDWRPE